MMNLDKLHYLVQALPCNAVVLHTGSHPDDEDSGLISYLANQSGARVIYWSATRGEKGQNSVSPYQDIDLGILRTMESQDAAEILHSEVVFGPVIDFGFCKSGDHALKRWNNLQDHDEIDWYNEIVTKSIVAAIRYYRPSLVISRWQGNAKDGHGHHQATAHATFHAFDLANDPKAFPELIKLGMLPWQPYKLYVSENNSSGRAEYGGFLNLYGNRNQALENRPDILKIDTSEFQLHSNETFQERAWKAFSQHRSQAMAKLPVTNPFFYYFRLLKSRVETESLDFFDGIDLHLSSVLEETSLEAAKLADQVDSASGEIREFFLNTNTFGPFNIQKVVDQLIPIVKKMPIDELLSLLEENTSSYRIIQRKKQLINQLMALVAQVRLEALIDKQYLSENETSSLTALFWNPSQLPISKAFFTLRFPSHFKIHEHAAHLSLSTAMKDDHPALLDRGDYIIEAGSDICYSVPSWLAAEPTGDQFQIPDESLPKSLGIYPLLSVSCRFTIMGCTFEITEPVVCLDPNRRGTRRMPAQVVPGYSVGSRFESYIVKKSRQIQKIPIHISCYSLIEENDRLQGSVFIETKDFAVEPPSLPCDPHYPFSPQKLTFNAICPPSLKTGSYRLQAVFQKGEKCYRNQLASVFQGQIGMGLPIEPDHFSAFREAHYLKASTFQIIVANVEVADNLSYGYFEGVRTKSFDMLKGLGLEIETLQAARIPDEDFTRFSAIIIGEHAYFMQPQLIMHNHVLLDYVKKGGTLIVHMQRNFFAEKKLAPYPVSYSMPHDRVTHHEAPVKILEPEHPIFHRPNRITAKDFNGWIEDRGLYFWKACGDEYLSLLDCKDPGENDSQHYGMCLARYGKGNYFYTGYTLFKQIERGVEGAVRLYANILAIPFIPFPVNKFINRREMTE